MIARYFYGALAVAILVASASITTFAQVGELRGVVLMQQADGQKVPLAEAQIDVFRTDITGQYNTKTNKKGEFVFAGLPFVGTYTVVASHPTATPNWVGGVKAGREIPVELTVTPGEGKRPTFDEVKAAGGGTQPKGSSGGGGSGESASDKAKREELLKKNAEIEAGNKKISATNEVIGRTFKAGNDALVAANAASKAQNSDEAIQKYTTALAQFDEGLGTDPQQPALLTNKAVALKGRGVEHFNATLRSKTLDDAGKAAGLKAAEDDAGKAVTLLKAQPVPTDPAEVEKYNKNKYAAMLTHAEAMRLYVSKADGTQADAGLAAYKDYIAVETDPAKKAKAQIEMAQMLLDSGAADKALVEFQAILTSQPDSPEANLGAGLAVYATGDKEKFQDAANYLQRFVEVAPDSNPMKSDANDILNEMKNTENVTPEKGKSTPKRRP